MYKVSSNMVGESIQSGNYEKQQKKVEECVQTQCRTTASLLP